MIVKVIVDAYSGYRMVATCVKQLNLSEFSDWEKEFRAYGPVDDSGFLKVDPEGPKPVCNDIGLHPT